MSCVFFCSVIHKANCSAHRRNPMFVSSCYFWAGLFQFFCNDYIKRKSWLMLQLSHQSRFFYIMMKSQNRSENDIVCWKRHSVWVCSDYRFDLKKPHCVSSEAIIIVFGNSSCRSRSVRHPSFLPALFLCLFYRSSFCKGLWVSAWWSAVEGRIF